MTYPPGPAPWQPTNGPVLGGLAYWRKNPFLAASMVPLVMTLVGGRFTATDQHGSVVWDAYAPEVSGKLGAMGTFKIQVQGHRFALVGRGSIGGTEAAVTQGQVQHLQRFLHQHPPTAALSEWRDGLAAAGAAVR